MSRGRLPAPPLPVSAPARVRDLLAAGPDGPVEVVHRGPLAVYLDLGGECVGLLAAGAALVPCGLRSRLRQISPGGPVAAYRGAGVLHVGGRPLLVGRTVDVHVPRLDRERIPANASDSTTGMATPPAAVVEFVASAAPHGLDAAAVHRLVGRGDGLTPLGDDVVCGWLAAHRALGVATPEVDDAVRAAASRTTLLSRTLLGCAVAGEVLPELGAWLHALTTPARLPGAAAALLAVGASSGAGLLAGAQLALRDLGVARPAEGSRAA